MTEPSFACMSDIASAATSSCHFLITSKSRCFNSPSTSDKLDSLESSSRSLLTTMYSHSCSQNGFSSVRIPSVKKVHENRFRVARLERRSLVGSSSSFRCREFARVAEVQTEVNLSIQAQILRNCLYMTTLIDLPRKHIAARVPGKSKPLHC